MENILVFELIKHIRWIRLYLHMLSQSVGIKLLLLVTFSLQLGVGAYCTCSPQVSTWRVDFTKSCPPIDIQSGLGTGISDDPSPFCLIYSDNGNADLTIVSLDYLDMLERDINWQTLSQKMYNGLSNGDTIEFVSTASVSSNRVLNYKLEGLGRNSNGEKIRMLWQFAYSFECDIYPFEGGTHAIGWTVLDSHIPAKAEFCNSPSPAPSSLLTSVPSYGMRLNVANFILYHSGQIIILLFCMLYLSLITNYATTTYSSK